MNALSTLKDHKPNFQSICKILKILILRCVMYHLQINKKTQVL